MLVYNQTKLSHSGITQYTAFEGLQRKIHRNSLSNLINNSQENSTVQQLSRTILNSRNLNATQSRKIKKAAGKLCYYTAQRNFTSKKKGDFKFKVAFLTLTAPQGTTIGQFNKAFEGFLDYLRRTANCVFVWKKEMGESNGNYHIHLLINNFIPYYIVSWKWKRLLIGQGISWPLNEKGKPTESHYRIELPKSKKLTAHYISKYLSKAHELPKEAGYVWGKSAILDDCKEEILFDSDFPYEEVEALKKNYRTIKDMFLMHICVDLTTCQRFAPELFKIFEAQYNRFQQTISLSQKFFYV